MILRYQKILASPHLMPERLEALQKHFNIELGYKLMVYLTATGEQVQVRASAMAQQEHLYGAVLFTQEVVLTPEEGPNAHQSHAVDGGPVCPQS